MDVIRAIAEFLVKDVLSQPYYLVGLMTAVGLIALRKRTGEVIGGALKATLGFLILVAGANVVVAALEPLGKLILGATGAQGVVPTNEAIVALAQSQYGATVAWTMIAGFLVSLFIARVTPLRYVFLTGHHIFFMATMISVILLTVGYSTLVAVLGGAVLLGTIMVVMPALTHPWMKKVTGGERVAMGHFGSLGYILGGISGQAVGKGSRSTEEMKFPQGLRFLREPMVATAVSMVVIYIIFALIFAARQGLGPVVEQLGLDPATNWGSFVMFNVLQALNFGVGVALILFGVRTILGEIVPAFAGIAERVVPGALPALDCPVAFPYAPNAVIIGFLASVVGGLISLALISSWLGAALGLALILPGMVPHFFTGGTAGVFGNATGGRRGAMVGGFVNGVLITFLPAFLLFVLGDLGFANTTFGDADFGWYGIVVGQGAQVSDVGGVVVLGVIVAALLTLAIWFQRRVVEAGWVPGGAVTVPEAEAKTRAKTTA
ncbi:MAG TPA: PTS ascorbate transporter subunit IIC [Actinomycetota bacterium]|nr:PTS ascorbate transporter subunit IIC [Actinomycetota bacterium]